VTVGDTLRVSAIGNTITMLNVTTGATASVTDRRHSGRWMGWHHLRRGAWEIDDFKLLKMKSS
jgi:hypothetical protein